MLLRKLFIILTVALTISTIDVVHAQLATKIECGAIIESEFLKPNEQHVHLLTMEPRSSFTVSAEAVGDKLVMAIGVVGPTDISIGSTPYVKAPSLNSGVLSSSKGVYTITFYNASGGVGLYTLSIGCVKSDGTVINPGDIPQPTPTPAPLPTPTPRSAIPASAPKFAGIGFPGLAPVDFSTVAKIPLLPDTVMTGILPIDNEILGFTLDAAAGDTLDLTYTRVSGNMNLGLVVLSAENKVFFQASLVTSEALTTRFTLPAAGQYTIGVFRISLVEPAKVEPTVFQLKGVLEHNN